LHTAPRLCPPLRGVSPIHLPLPVIEGAGGHSFTKSATSWLMPTHQYRAATTAIVRSRPGCRVVSCSTERTEERSAGGRTGTAKRSKPSAESESRQSNPSRTAKRLD
jgi:hypothetical protein